MFELEKRVKMIEVSRSFTTIDTSLAGNFIKFYQVSSSKILPDNVTNYLEN